MKTPPAVPQAAPSSDISFHDQLCFVPLRAEVLSQCLVRQTHDAFDVSLSIALRDVG